MLTKNAVLNGVHLVKFMNTNVDLLNPLMANVPILYSLKTTENLRFSGIFREYKMGILARSGLSQNVAYVAYKTQNRDSRIEISSFYNGYYHRNIR